MAILNMAINENNQKLIKRIFENDLLKDQFDINSRDENGYSCLQVAFNTYLQFNNISEFFVDGDRNINTDTFAYLLNHGADIKKQSRENNISLFYKVLNYKQYDILKCILNHKSFIDSIDFYGDINESFDPKKAISFSKFFKFISRSGYTTKEAFTKDIFSNPKFKQELDMYIKNNIIESKDMSRYNEILNAICKNDIDTVKAEMNYFNSHRINISVIDYITNGFTPLILSYLLNKREIFEYLFPYCNLYRSDGHGNTILHYSIIKEDTKMVERLFRCGLKLKKNKFIDIVQLITLYGNKTIFFTVLNNSQEIISNRKTNYNTSDDIDVNNIEKVYKDFDIREVLNEFQIMVIRSKKFSIEDKIEIMKYLLELGVDINYEKNEEGIRRSPLTCAVGINDYENGIKLIKLLIEKGADIDKSYGNEETFLIESVYDKNIPLINYLIERGVDVNCHEEGISPLSAAIEKEDVSVVKLLIEKGANINEEIPDRNRGSESLLMSCIKMELIEIAKIFMEHHAKIIYHEQNNYFTLIRMLNNSELELASYIRQENIDIGSPERIDSLIVLGRLDLLKILYKYQFLNVNVKDEHGNTPIFNAVKHSKDSIVKFLMECGADTNVENKNGETIESINRKFNYTYNRATYNKFKRLKVSK
ncbi:hypothetical protein PIROE2DRAFT_61613 [Piromyces sp. E2]|nr:hypothetical protein PIROE2DRAFT_61613 [Piromyces sp. E2]|eukprot:OUM62871.1 hypothetical protein PIROE2DRAFT_61613 [Piromyces sp. E2]